MFCTLLFTFRASAIALPASGPTLLYPMLKNIKKQYKKKIRTNDPRWIRFRNVEIQKNELQVLT
jgi:hypothetical protein